MVVEAVDRLSRRLADLANFHDIVDFRKVKLYATDRGEINAGLSAGSLGYGYKVDPATKGKQIIFEEEAKVVRRIFEDYANGAAPRTIAATLNKEGVPGPRGSSWIDTTIRGQVDRGTGLLNNDLYIGRLLWNRCSYVHDPSTGKRVARPNPKDEWEEATDASLRIVDDPLGARQGAAGRSAHGHAKGRKRRPPEPRAPGQASSVRADLLRRMRLVIRNARRHVLWLQQCPFEGDLHAKPIGEAR